MMQQKTAVTVPARRIEKRRNWEKCPQCAHIVSLHSIFPAFETLYMHLKCSCGCQAIISSVDKNEDPFRHKTTSPRVPEEWELDFKSFVHRPIEEAVLRRERHRTIGEQRLRENVNQKRRRLEIIVWSRTGIVVTTGKGVSCQKAHAPCARKSAIRKPRGDKK